jgi:branched-subunit amino acid aminotransferase/4-amino-4-deoxychorismate lyase
MRAHNKKIVYLNEHIKRITSAAKAIKIKNPHSLLRLKKMIQTALRNTRFKDVYIKLTLLKSSIAARLTLEVKKYQPLTAQKYREGFSGLVSNFWKDECNALSGIKTTERLLYELSFHEAKARGFDEAIILNSRGLLAEGSKTNVFFVKDKVLFTPSLKCGCLNGITRMAVSDLAKKHKIKIKEGNFTIYDLFDADEAFVTNSLIGIMPLKKVNKIRIGRGAGSMTQLLRKKYCELLYAAKKN